MKMTRMTILMITKRREIIMMTVIVMTTIGKDRSSKTLLALPSFSPGLLCRRRSRRAFKISTLKIFNSFQI